MVQNPATSEYARRAPGGLAIVSIWGGSSLCLAELPGGRHRYSPTRRHRPRSMIGDNMMWGSDYPHSESTFPRSRQILAEILEGVPHDEQARSWAPTPPACTIST